MKIEFKNSNLQSTINAVKTIEGLKNYKEVAEEALALCEAKLKEKNGI